jgi:Isochorismatase family
MKACASISGCHDGGRPQVVIAGIEARVCVAQTAIDMAQAGFGVFVVADAVSSRAEASVALALPAWGNRELRWSRRKWPFFELVGRAGTSEFKELSLLIK